MTEIICPHCKNPIYDDDALLCHFCGESLNRGSSGLIGHMSKGSWKWVFVSIAAVVLVSFLLLIL